MKVTTIFTALCIAVSAQYLPRRQEAPFDVTSIAQALGTALPTSLLEQAVTDPAGVASMIQADFAAGETPDWFRTLPSSLQSQLLRTDVAVPVPTGSTTRAPYALPPIPGSTLNPSQLSSLVYTGPSSSSRTLSSSAATMTSSSTSGSSAFTSSVPVSGSSSPGASSSGSSSVPTISTPLISSNPGESSSGPESAGQTSTGGAVPTMVAGLGMSGLVGLAGLFALY